MCQSQRSRGNNEPNMSRVEEAQMLIRGESQKGGDELACRGRVWPSQKKGLKRKKVLEGRGSRKRWRQKDGEREPHAGKDNAFFTRHRHPE